MTRQEIEGALDIGQLWVQVNRGSPTRKGSVWWRVRRNGRTKLWKREPHRFRIPIKRGFKDCGAVTEESVVAQFPSAGDWNHDRNRFHLLDFMVSSEDPNVMAKYASEFEYKVAMGAKK